MGTASRRKWLNRAARRASLCDCGGQMLYRATEDGADCAKCGVFRSGQVQAQRLSPRWISVVASLGRLTARINRASRVQFAQGHNRVDPATNQFGGPLDA